MEFKDDDIDYEFQQKKLLTTKLEYTSIVKRNRKKSNETKSDLKASKDSNLRMEVVADNEHIQEIKHEIQKVSTPLNETNVIVNTRIDTELLFFLLIYNDDFVLLLVWLSLELRCLSPK